MEQPTIISWNPANWITVVLMVTVFYLLIGMIAKIVQQRRATKGQA